MRIREREQTEFGVHRRAIAVKRRRQLFFAGFAPAGILGNPQRNPVTKNRITDGCPLQFLRIVNYHGSLARLCRPNRPTARSPEQQNKKNSHWISSRSFRPL